MFPLPKYFDENEWTIIVGIFLSILLWRLPKKIPTEITILIILFSMAVPKIMDHLIASVSPNLYQITDSEKYELFDLLLDIVYSFWIFMYLCIRNLETEKIEACFLHFHLVSFFCLFRICHGKSTCIYLQRMEISLFISYLYHGHHRCSIILCFFNKI
jgi:hypothetical protein